MKIRSEIEKNKESRIRFIDAETAIFLLGLRPKDFRPETKVLSYKIPNSTRLKKDLAAINVAYRTDSGDLDFHALRHTHATMLSASGAPTAVVQQLLGHKTRAMAERYTIQSGLNVDSALNNLKDVFETEKCTGLPDFSGHSPSQAVTEETVSENVSTPANVTDRHENAPPVRERHKPLKWW